MHKQYTHHKNGSCTNISTHKSITPNDGMDSRQINREANNEQVISDKRVPGKRGNDDKTKKMDGYIRTRYDGIIRKPDRPGY